MTQKEAIEVLTNAFTPKIVGTSWEDMKEAYRLAISALQAQGDGKIEYNKIEALCMCEGQKAFEEGKSRGGQYKAIAKALVGHLSHPPSPEKCVCDYNKLFGDNVHFVEKSVAENDDGICMRCHRKRVPPSPCGEEKYTDGHAEALLENDVIRLTQECQRYRLALESILEYRASKNKIIHDILNIAKSALEVGKE